MTARRLAWMAAAAAGALASSALTWLAWPLPADVLRPELATGNGITLTDREGVTLRTTRTAGGSRARWMPLAQIDPDIIAAFIAVEDKRFFSHHGVDWMGAVRAARDNVMQRRVVSGGSTITMQLARLVRPSPRDLPGKVKQVLWALRLELHLTKQDILERYFNRVELGQGVIGVGAAASLYFDADAADVSLAQAAMLAGMAHAPSRDNPMVSASRAAARRSFALSRLETVGYASAGEVLRARAEPLMSTRPGAVFLAPHFTTRALALLHDGAECGGDDTEPDAVEREFLITRSGCVAVGTIRTSLDLALQSAIESEVRATVFALRDRGVEHAAAIVVDNASGAVRAWVGSPDFWADTAGQTDMVVSPRQPGSALKPFLYGLAFDRGATPATVIADIAHSYATSTGPYRPRNYDHKYHGPVRAREALASSYNVPAVELVTRVGPAAFLRTLHAAGFASLSRSPDYYGLGLALGDGDVTLIELANAYRSLANGGVWQPLRLTGDEAASGAVRGTRVMSARSAALVLDMLADAHARAPGFGDATPFDFPFRAAVKTGTSRHFTDNWAVGVTAGFTIAVWVGNFNGHPMEGVSGVAGAGPLLAHAMMLAANRVAPGDLVRPEAVGAVAMDICAVSGMRAGPSCPRITEWFAPGTAPAAECDWHNNGVLTLPALYAEWAAQAAQASHAAAAPPAMSREFRIVSPRDGDRYAIPPGVPARYATVALLTAGAPRGQSIAWFVDGRATAGSRLALTPGAHVIRAVAERMHDEVRVEVE